MLFKAVLRQFASDIRQIGTVDQSLDSDLRTYLIKIADRLDFWLGKRPLVSDMLNTKTPNFRDCIRDETKV